ncbi:hypothetical protein SKAU_G00244380 [Synaphobranchus kaupii]|uniref:Uncharacterized protein n=1 Tax=Synaphobranchus kaupii TaxID=118154 RepID=A0A9Q1F1K5_SYNKA|nr:hypothetical protein SKAU_G00244380 [Synaphobranchus kaupii]
MARQTQRDTSPGHRHGHGGWANQDGLGAKRRSKAVMSRAESDLTAWRRVQAQVTSHKTCRQQHPLPYPKPHPNVYSLTLNHTPSPPLP